MSGRRLAKLARIPGLIITEDVPVTLLDTAARPAEVLVEAAVGPRDRSQCALVRDAGADARDRDRGLGHRRDAARLRGAERQAGRLRQLGKPNGSRDGRGHGSFVAGIAAGSAAGYAGVAPNAPLVSLDVMDDSGSGRTSDVIAATEWIFENHDEKHQGRELLAARRRQGPLLRGSAEQGGLEAVVRRRDGDRGCGQLRQGRGPERRELRSRQQPVRGHGRGDRHRRHR